jgi:hypothetical protein
MITIAATILFLLVSVVSKGCQETKGLFADGKAKTIGTTKTSFGTDLN